MFWKNRFRKEFSFSKTDLGKTGFGKTDVAWKIGFGKT